jgi:hypothetical protein
MDVRRSFYFAPGQGDLAEAASEESRLDYDDIPLVPPANDNFRPKSRLSWGTVLPRLFDTINMTTRDPRAQRKLFDSVTCALAELSESKPPSAAIVPVRAR